MEPFHNGANKKGCIEGQKIERSKFGMHICIVTELIFLRTKYDLRTKHGNILVVCSNLSCNKYSTLAIENKTEEISYN